MHQARYQGRNQESVYRYDKSHRSAMHIARGTDAILLADGSGSEASPKYNNVLLFENQYSNPKVSTRFEGNV